MRFSVESVWSVKQVGIEARRSQFARVAEASKDIDPCSFKIESQGFSFTTLFASLFSFLCFHVLVLDKTYKCGVE